MIVQELIDTSIRLISRISAHNWRLKVAWLNRRIHWSLALPGQQPVDWPRIAVGPTWLHHIVTVPCAALQLYMHFNLPRTSCYAEPEHSATVPAA